MDGLDELLRGLTDALRRAQKTGGLELEIRLRVGQSPAPKRRATPSKRQRKKPKPKPAAPATPDLAAPVVTVPHAATHDTASSYRLLAYAGVIGDVCADLAAEFPATRVAQCLAGVSRQAHGRAKTNGTAPRVRSPAGYVVSALKNGWYQGLRLTDEERRRMVELTSGESPDGRGESG